MVLAGQYLERPALIPAGALTLEGLSHRGDRAPALLICPPVGGVGPAGGMDAPAVAELAWVAARAGHPSLRFQLRGLGASTGEVDPARAADDAEAALEHLRATAARRVALAALGDGWRLAWALARAHPGLGRVALLAPDRAPDPAPPDVEVLALLPGLGPAPAEDEVRAALGPRGRVEVLERADAAFRAGLAEAARRAVAFACGR